MKHSHGEKTVHVRVLHVGAMASCCYVAGVQGEEAMIIDPGEEAGRIIEAAEQMAAKVTHIVLTHGHADHIAALEEVRGHFPEAAVVIHTDDAAMLERPSLNLSLFLGGSVKCKPATTLLHGKETFEVADFTVKVMHLPGHTPGGICLYMPEIAVLFSGDILFAGGIGRSDFPGGDQDLLLMGIRDKLMTLPPETTVYPGHGPATTIGEESESNPFLEL